MNYSLNKLKTKIIDEPRFSGLNIKGGDTVWIEYRDDVESTRLKTFTGICLSSMPKGTDTVIKLRTIIGGVSVEYGFHTLSKNIKNIKIVRKKRKSGGRIKRYDLRKNIMR